MQVMTDFKVLTGNPTQLGVDKTQSGYNFAVSVPDGAPADLLIYRYGSREPEQVIPLPEPERTGQVSAVLLELPSGQKWEYNYRVGEQVVPDPYAREVRTLPTDHETDRGEEFRCSLECPAGASSRPLEIAYEDSVIYKTHVRGFTKQSRSKVKHKGTFLGVKEKIPYLKELGITALMLMPVYEFEKVPRHGRECRHIMDIGEMSETGIRENYWGYTGGLYFAPRRYYCATEHPTQEFADLVDALHGAGIECILEFYFGADMAVQAVLDVLHYWMLNYQVDGFHLLGQGQWIGPVAEDALLKKSKLLYLSFDAEHLYEGGKVPYYKNLAELNLGYEGMMRRFLKGDGECLEGAAWYLRKNGDAVGCVNYFADQDGFTMADMVSFEQKHNERNGEGGRDGSNYNYSWNCGVEGPTKKMSVRKLRRQQLYNAFLMLFTSQGTPLIYGGDEFCNSQSGNNNAWCQDNETGWLSWGRTKDGEQLKKVVRQAIEFRRGHPILHKKGPVRLMDYKACGCPDLSYHSRRAWVFPADSSGRSLGVMYCGAYARRADGKEDDSIYIAYNLHWEPYTFTLPNLKKDMKWSVKADTSRDEVFYPEGEEKVLKDSDEKSILVPPRTVMILIGK